MARTADELLDLAWGVIANAGWDGLSKTDHWQESAVRWRDDYHAYLDALAQEHHSTGEGSGNRDHGGS